MDISQSRQRPAPTSRLALILLFLAVTAAQPVPAAEPAGLDALRAEALTAVNADRAAHGLDPLTLSPPLTAAAQEHAADMLARGYFEHASPEGDTVDDRYARHGGPPWHLVAENLAQCSGCPAPVEANRIRDLEAGWMDSPGHRKNILTRGLAEFGFGIAVEGEELYAVQTFGGPGVPPGIGADERPEPISAQDAGAAVLALVNNARLAQGVAPLQANGVLEGVAESLLPDDPDKDFAFRNEDLEQALPSEQRDAWASLSASTATCGGCGAEMTKADLHHFTTQWLQGQDTVAALLSGSMSHLGFAAFGSGDGRKLAVLVLGRAR
jgi:uncharacterized protein YkwD